MPFFSANQNARGSRWGCDNGCGSNDCGSCWNSGGYTPDEYKAARGVAWLYNNSGKSAKEVIAEYAAEQNCTEETAAEYLTLARQNRSRVMPEG